MKRLPWLLLSLSPLLGCQFVLDVDQPQCESDGECVGLFGRGFVCSEQRICIAEVVDMTMADAGMADAGGEDGGGDASTGPSLPDNWRCLVDPPKPVTPQLNRFVEMRMQVADFTTGTVPPDLTGKACLASDVACDAPYLEGVTPNEQSEMVFMLPHAWRGYLQFSAPEFVDTLVFSNQPFTGGTGPQSPAVLTERSLRSIAAGGGEEIDATKGIALIAVYDCDGNAAPGVRFEQEDSESDEPPFYFEGSLPDRQRSTTMVSDQLSSARTPLAVGGFSQVRAGYVSFIGVLAETGDKVGQVTVQVRPLTLTIAELHAGY